jgi:hypothetical protein
VTEVDAEGPEPPLERAREIVAQLERRAAEKALWVFVRALEQIEDLWAEAQTLHKRSSGR